MNVHLVRLDIAREDPAANRARVGQLVDRASPAAGDRAVLPETAFIGFSLDSSRTMSDARAAEDLLAPSPGDKAAAFSAGWSRPIPMAGRQTKPRLHSRRRTPGPLRASSTSAFFFAGDHHPLRLPGTPVRPTASRLTLSAGLPLQ